MTRLQILFLLLIVTIFVTGVALTSFSDVTGEQVFKANCGKCHTERYAAERSDADWKVIITHMRVRANLTAKEAQKVLEYLQENNPEQ